MIEYTDKLGRVVLKRVQAGTSTTINNTDYASTSYIYDDFGNLVCVIQPEGMKQINAYLDGTAGEKEAFLEKWAFRYKYDGRRRMTIKQVPGAAPVYMVYDKRDRLVLTQDGNQRVNNQWLFTKYDPLNRPVMTGVYTHADSIGREAMNALISTTTFCERYDGNTTFHGYTSNVFPTQSLDVLTVTYYEDYAFIDDLAGTAYGFAAGHLAGQEIANNTRVRGQVTGAKTKVLGDTTAWLWTATYYDHKYRPIQTVTTNTRGNGVDRTTSVYDFVGKVLNTKTTTEGYDIARRMEYDHAGRLLETWHSLEADSNPVRWIEQMNTTLQDGKLVKTSGADGYNAGARTENYLEAGQDGWFEVKAESNYRVVFGLSDVNVNANFTTIDYAVYLNPNQNLVVYENGQGIATIGTYTTGDVIRVERVGQAVHYKKNGATLYTSSVPSATALFGDVSLYYIGDKVTGARMSAGTPARLLAKNEYNELGQLVVKKLHSEDGAAFKQEVDHAYNIRGWLNTINDPDAPDPGDLFSMKLNYNTPTASGGAAQFNGNISEIVWNTAGYDKQSYGYTYDPMNRLWKADYYNQQSPSENGRYNEYIHHNNASGYDLNGNILRLQRNGKKATTPQGNIDNLTYSYIGNQLHVVNDATADHAEEIGFKELTGKSFNAGNPSTWEYTYDANGNMTRDDNKGITSIEYNHLNLPAKVSKSASEYIVYTYDATGRKLRQQVFGPQAKVTDYAGELIFENDTLQFINTEEGRVVMTGAEPEYQYHLKDHLGNVRLTFTTLRRTDEATATLEAGNLATEQEEFLRYEHARRVQASLFDRTNGSSPGYSQRLNGSADEIYGLARSLSVMPGDTVSAEVYVKYVDPEPGNWNQALTNLMTAIANNTGGIVVDGSGYSGSTATFPHSGLLNTSGSGNAPEAFLNWIVFDRDFNMLDGGFVQVSTAARETGTDTPHERLAKDNIIITKPGYVYIYLSNENGELVDVFFDDFRVEHVHGAVMQVDDYYPFGLTFNSYQRENSVENKIKFQGQEHIDDLNLGWVQFKWRNHMPDIGRFFNIDPLADKYVYNSPYAFSENHVVRHVELEGLEKADFMVAVAEPNSRAYRGPTQPRAEKHNTNFGKGMSEYYSNEYMVFTVDLQTGHHSVKTAVDQEKNFISSAIDMFKGNVTELDYTLEVNISENGFEITGDMDGTGFSISGNVTNDHINVTTQMTNVSEDEAGVIKMYGGENYFFRPVVIGTKQGSDCFFCGSEDSVKQSSSVPYTMDNNGNARLDSDYQKKNEDENTKKPTKKD